MNKINKTTLTNFSIVHFNAKSIVDAIISASDENEKTVFIGMNADCFNTATNNNAYLRILQNERYYIYPDGMSIVWALNFLRGVKQERIVTTDLILHLLDRISIGTKKITIGFIGGNNNIAEEAKNNLNEKFNCNAISFSYEPEFVSLEEAGDRENNKIKTLVEKLNENPTDILLIGFGCPKQETLSNTILDSIPQKVILTCGGLFSYYSGDHKRAPFWMQDLGLEWLFRLSLEPKRLWKRYLVGNFSFIYKILAEKLHK